MSVEKASVRRQSSSQDGSTVKEDEVGASLHKDRVPQVQAHRRSKFQRVPFVSLKAPPPKASLDDADMSPEATAGFFSQLIFHWVTPIISLGYARPLEAPDLYKLQDDLGAAYIGDKITESFRRRSIAASEYNAQLLNGDIKPSVCKRMYWAFRGNAAEREKDWRETHGRRTASLMMAMNDAVKWWFWSSGLMKLSADVAQVTSPLLVKAIVKFASTSFSNHALKNYDAIPSIGHGVGMAIGLLILQVIASISIHQFFYRSASAGALLRGGLINAIYSRSLRLSSRARSKLTNGLIMNHISTDVSRIDFCCGFFHMSWTAPIQLAICLLLLLLNIGPSALTGFALFFVAAPIQTWVMKHMLAFRQNSMLWTDKRAKLLQELLSGMKVVKFFAWEVPFLKRVQEYRKAEMSYIRSLLLVRSGVNAVAVSMPVLASVVSFVTYSATGHELEPDNIFASLALFNLLRLPLMFLPVSLAAIADAYSGIQRLTGVFEAELLEDLIDRDDMLPNALEVKNVTFTWDAPVPEQQDEKQTKTAPPTEYEKAATDKGSSEIFQIRNLTMKVPRGRLVAIVGAVGSGKTSLLQGLIGEMRQIPNEEGVTNRIKYGGSVGYCPQSAWIQNATIKANICFGRPFEEERYWKCVKDSCLERDLDMLPNGDLTEVGEKGISLSGGQKQRLNICRTIYCGADIQIFDDPLSALDAHVGKEVFNKVLQDASLGQTRILVTHALHFLPQVDYIYTIKDGRIAEEGSYLELMRKEGDFCLFFKEFGSKEDPAEEEEDNTNAKEAEEANAPRKAATAGAALMQLEERNTGSVGFGVYKSYVQSGRGNIVMPFLVISAILAPAATTVSSYWLVFWQERHWDLPNGFYMGIYAGLGSSVAIANFLIGGAFSMLTYYASQELHNKAITRIMHAPMSFFETTPLGRIMNRFSKDFDTLDNLLSESLRLMVTSVATVLGAVVLIAIVLPWFLIAVAAVLVLYGYAAAYYRASARELKRLDAVLRSSLYSHFSESLSGIPTIRAYGETDRFLRENENRINIENRAYWLTIVNQRWLAIRLDFLGILLTFVVSMLTIGTRFTISPSQTGVALSYILSIQQVFGFLVRQMAEVENDMNSVERIVYYSTEIEQEASHEVPERAPKGTWPSVGRVELRDVVFKYRPSLPAVLKGLTMTVEAGEKVGIVGRTGAGKSSIMSALYRLVELSSGSIVIDGVDISTVGLSDLRKGLSIIPQDALLFSGTLRSNIDPFSLHDDATLWDALRRSYLVESHKDGDESSSRFTLDSVIEDEGVNLSIGQRSLVSLARALVKNSKILILDEATASVDYETDRNIQDTISTEFKDRTILCIAHRLRTIISYDRVCVLDAGQIAEFDKPEVLFHRAEGIFRGMCDRSSITLDDIRFARKEA